MKKILCGIALTGIVSTVCAHESWAPHTHSVENSHSDLFYLSLAGVFLFLLVGFGVRARKLIKRREGNAFQTRTHAD